MTRASPGRKAFAKLPKDTFSVFLYHSPDLLLAAATHGADLFLTGHTHGGQIAMPWYGALVTLTDVGKPWQRCRTRVEPCQEPFVRPVPARQDRPGAFDAPRRMVPR